MAVAFDSSLESPKTSLVRHGDDLSSTQKRGQPDPKPAEVIDQIVSGIVDRAFSQVELNAYHRRQHVHLTPQRGLKAMTRPVPTTPSKMVYPTNRPNWWDSTHRLLNLLTVSNQEEPISEADLDKIRQVASHVIQVGDPVQSLLFLKLLSDFIVFGAKGIFFEVLNSLRSVHPDIDIYFKDVDVDEPDEGPVFTPEAIDRIFQFFEEEYQYPAGILSAQDLSALPGLVEEMIESEDGSIRGWVVYNDQMVEDPHVVPVFAIRKEGTTHVFIFDSVGHTFSPEKADLKTSASLEALIAHFQDKPDQLAIYSYQIRRQNSDLGCSTFAILDLKNLLERHLSGPGDIVDFYASQKGNLKPKLGNPTLALDSRLPIFEISTLPPEMMKVTQSFGRIRQYSKESPVDDHVPSVMRFSSSWQTFRKPQTFADLDSTVSEIARTAPDGSVKNLYVDSKRLKFIVYLLGLHFNQPLSLSPSSHPRALPKVGRRLFGDDEDYKAGDPMLVPFSPPVDPLPDEPPPADLD